MILLRPLAYLWASPNTALGLLFVVPALLSGGRVRFEHGALEVYGGFARFFLRHNELSAGQRVTAACTAGSPGSSCGTACS